MRRWSFLLVGILVLVVINTAWAIAGLIANPSFATGDAVTWVRVLGVDFNGWHAIAGLVVFVPGFYLLVRPDLARVYAIAVIVALVPSGLIALVNSRPLGIFPYEHEVAELTYHLGTAALFAGLLVADRVLRPKPVLVG
jgi:hypothetical protein